MFRVLRISLECRHVITYTMFKRSLSLHSEKGGIKVVAKGYVLLPTYHFTKKDCVQSDILSIFHLNARSHVNRISTWKLRNITAICLFQITRSIIQVFGVNINSNEIYYIFWWLVRSYFWHNAFVTSGKDLCSINR